jgi:hypothetical protein
MTMKYIAQFSYDRPDLTLVDIEETEHFYKPVPGAVPQHIIGEIWLPTRGRRESKKGMGFFDTLNEALAYLTERVNAHIESNWQQIARLHKNIEKTTSLLAPLEALKTHGDAP